MRSERLEEYERVCVYHLDFEISVEMRTNGEEGCVLGSLC